MNSGNLCVGIQYELPIFKSIHITFTREYMYLILYGQPVVDSIELYITDLFYLTINRRIHVGTFPFFGWKCFVDDIEIR